MKKVLIVLIIMVSVKITIAQTKKIDTIDIKQPIVDSSKRVYAAVESEAEFPGGMQQFYNYISSNMHIPISEYVKGMVHVRFIVGLDGHIIEPAIIKGAVTDFMKKEIIRVFIGSPAWKPSIQNGKPVRTEYTIPINF